MRLEEDGRVTNETAEDSLRSLGKGESHGFLVFGLSHPDFDELVGKKLSLDVVDHRIRHPRLSNLNHRLEPVGLAPEEFTLKTSELFQDIHPHPLMEQNRNI